MSKVLTTVLMRPPPGVSSVGKCCESCMSSPGANCTHWTWDGTECTQWSGGNCKQQSAVGATSANIKKAVPSPSPPSPGSMPVYHQMLWDADLYIGRLVDVVHVAWSNAVIFYSADNGTSHADNGATFQCVIPL